MNLMPCRYVTLQHVLDGYLKTGTHLVEFGGNSIQPIFSVKPGESWGAVDDIGIYVFIPKITKLLSISLESAIYLFFNGLIICSGLIGFVGILLLYRSWSQRIIGTVSVAAISYLSYTINDLYITYSICILMVIPLFLYFMKSRTFKKLFIVFLFLAGIIIGCCHYMRSYSSLGVLIFVVVSIFLSDQLFFNFKRRFFLIVTLCAGIIPPFFYFSFLMNFGDNYLSIHAPLVKKKRYNHPLWHPIYVGFGFLNYLNNEQIEWSDEAGLIKAREQNKSIEYGDPEYDEIIKNETIALIKKYPFFVLGTLFAKFGILLFFILKYVHVGLIAIITQFQWRTSMPFILGIASYALFALIAVPVECYSLGFICLAHFYAMISVNDFIADESINKKVRATLGIFFVLLTCGAVGLIRFIARYTIKPVLKLIVRAE